MGPRGLEDYGSEGLQLIKEKLTLHYPPSTTPYRTMQKDAEGEREVMGVGWLRDAEILEGFPLGVEKRFCAVLPQ